MGRKPTPLFVCVCQACFSADGENRFKMYFVHRLHRKAAHSRRHLHAYEGGCDEQRADQTRLKPADRDGKPVHHKAVADSGYGSEVNSRFMEGTDIAADVKCIRNHREQHMHDEPNPFRPQSL